MKHVLWAVCLLSLLALALSGCGAYHRPDFRGTRATSATVVPPKDTPKTPIVEWGSPQAKVRVLAFFFNSTEAPYPALMKLLQDQVKQYPNKLYVKYADLRTPEGADLRTRTSSGATGAGLLIDGKSSFTVKAKPYDYTVNFDQEPGRFWTEDQLKAVIAQEIAAAYRKGA